MLIRRCSLLPSCCTDGKPHLRLQTLSPFILVCAYWVRPMNRITRKSHTGMKIKPPRGLLRRFSSARNRFNQRLSEDCLDPTIDPPSTTTTNTSGIPVPLSPTSQTKSLWIPPLFSFSSWRRRLRLLRTDSNTGLDSDSDTESITTKAPAPPPTPIGGVHTPHPRLLRFFDSYDRGMIRDGEDEEDDSEYDTADEGEDREMDALHKTQHGQHLTT
ncbi:uncharacterized protein FOMMEDRAFT_156913 [Fomitiporia mediterranea MF3/22]|uniref:uncharacterized protein n=1 Tax=Fomitiporia mediterranea (strain MF3/22) TaxID=694068 RepID=UPI0004409356|nr:uncharacterized protein FOMMEDRAFT_156913 [Fomitiporia mediterranea MF3/22]EJD01788.1 hypothetical protein FOMMEDRAFT_156913 [Fomitiporia mediterranea MF3/22]